MYEFLHVEAAGYGRLRTSVQEVFAQRRVFGVNLQTTLPIAGEIRATGKGSNRRTLIQAALGLPVAPYERTVLATTSLTLETLAAMAIIWERGECGNKRSAASKARLGLLEQAALYGYTPWHPTPLPTVAEPWPNGGLLSIWSYRPFALLQAAVLDRSAPLCDRVAIVRQWIVSGEEPNSQYGALVDTRRTTLVHAFLSHKAKVVIDNKVAVVWTSIGSIEQIGFHCRPVAVGVVTNREVQGLRVEIVCYDLARFDKAALTRALNKLSGGGWEHTDLAVRTSRPCKTALKLIVQKVNECS